jgi:lysyl-tRNA synthetase class 2
MPSSVIRNFHYSEKSRALRVQFVTGRVYIYQNVPAAIASKFRTAASKGEFFNAFIRDHYAFSRAEDVAQRMH